MKPRKLLIPLAIVAVGALVWWAIDTKGQREKANREVDFQKVTV